MKSSLKKAVESYQCSGCVCGSDVSCYEPHDYGEGCGKHHAGTMLSSVGSIFLGLPTGFNRLGACDKTRVLIFDKVPPEFDKFNIPVWKYKNEVGDILIRGLMPRLNYPFICVIPQGNIADIDCLELTDTDLNGMD